MRGQYYLYVILGASLWGTISLFVNGLYDSGFSALQIVALRTLSASLVLLVYSILTDRTLLKIDWKDIFWFVGTGLFSIVFFNWCYFYTIKEASVSMAVVLLYTAPAMVTLLSRFLFKELLTVNKVVSLGLALTGLVIITGLYLPREMKLSFLGLMTGLGSGLGYALYSVLGRMILRKYRPLTMINYTFFVASAFLVPVLSGLASAGTLLSGSVLVSVMGLGIFPTAIAYILYTKGLEHIETSRASIVATIEPVVGILIGIAVFGDLITGIQWIGVLLVISSVILVSRD